MSCSSTKDFESGKNRVNVDPISTVLSTVNRPPIASANLFEILNPKPVPPKRLDIVLFS